MTNEPTPPATPTDPESEVVVRLSSMNDVTYRDEVSTRVSRDEWLQLTQDERSEAIADTVLVHVDATVLDEPQPAERERWPEEYRGAR